MQLAMMGMSTNRTGQSGEPGTEASCLGEPGPEREAKARTQESLRLYRAHRQTIVYPYDG